MICVCYLDIILIRLSLYILLPVLIGDSGEAELLVWAVNNITNTKGPVPLIGSAVTTSRELGWPVEIPDTLLVPETPPFTWNYTEQVQEPGGPGSAVGTRGRSIISLEEGQVFEIVLQNARALNGVAEFHPWHAHGHSFWVVGSGDGIFDPDTDPATYNLENPILRDTVNLWPLQWTALRFVANNPGVWNFHCHITAHLVMGMGFNMIVQPDMVEDPSESVLFCGSHGLEAFEEDPDKVTDPQDTKAPSEEPSGASPLFCAAVGWLFVCSLFLAWSW